MTRTETTSELDQALHASVMKREAVKEKAEAEKKAARDAEVMLGMGSTDMTTEELRKLIDSDRRMYYRTESLNDKLYIHYKGWKKIQNLEGWTGLKTIYADCNAFSKIEGLDNLRMLRSLFLQDNCIRKIEGLEGCPHLWSLNLSNNFVERIEGLSQLRGLNTLVISKNKIGHGGVEDVEHLVQCKSLSSVDMQDNRIEDPDVLPEVFASMRNLRVLYLKGNGCCKKIVNYRKSTTVYCTNLKYLDDRPVFQDDRRAAEAFNRGGIEEERAERRRIKEQEKENHRKNMDAFSRMIEDVRERKRNQDAMRAEDKYTEETDPVDTREKQMDRQVEKWREENKEQLKDDAREHAEKVLKAEKEERAKAKAEKGEDLTAVAPDENEPEQQEEGASKQKEDNRKLVYEDIWDDAPAEPAPAPKFAPPPRTSGTQESAGAAPAPFMPWASGASNMDSMAPRPDAIERRKEQLRAVREEAAAATSEDKSKTANSWYARYAQKVAQTSAKLQSKPESAPAAPAGSLAAVAGDFQEREQARLAASQAEEGEALEKESPSVASAEHKVTEPVAVAPSVNTELDEMD
eukprot:gnl/TRDRNA2_/TRDRNA2_183793_c0_seq1.p1 gnl/TRDRNA2_/TRDRNA2_183793_c0~~gnl/TRDRNA2_/TRDRNA2_183793_c0_seq1.p1  ORF type:complete len:576 (+),score=164.24 gnl/TRDRNA2_/TRDRNA2_183793_c0_seq1:119-1846(+)